MRTHRNHQKISQNENPLKTTKNFPLSCKCCLREHCIVYGFHAHYRHLAFLMILKSHSCSALAHAHIKVILTLTAPQSDTEVKTVRKQKPQL